MKLIKRALEIYTQDGFIPLAQSFGEYIRWKNFLLLSNICNNLYRVKHNYNYFDIMSEDWDNLVLLDACRYDLFRKTNYIPGKLKKRHSSGSSTAEFLQKTVTEEYLDTVYITANPQYKKWDLDGEFYQVIDVWESDWNNELGTVSPDDVTKAAIKAHEEYPNKRLLIHYLQPHYPFIGPSGLSLPDTDRIESLVQEVKENEVNESHDVWELLERGVVSKSDVVSAYQENLEIVLPHVEDLMERVDGKTIITSDHGNLYGERVFPFLSKIYGHPTGIHAENLIEVPWLVVPEKSRRKISSGEKKKEKDKEINKNVYDRLEDLGYK